jgi:hypothetical protein
MRELVAMVNRKLCADDRVVFSRVYPGWYRLVLKGRGVLVAEGSIVYIAQWLIDAFNQAIKSSD